MKNNKGITLISLAMYVVAFAIIAGIVGTITTFFYSNVVDLRDSANSLGEYEKFNAAILEEVKKSESKIVSIENNGRKITFTSGTIFSFEQSDGGIYTNNVKLCEGVKECIFSIKENSVKPTIRVFLEIGDDFAKTLEYVLNTNEIMEEKTEHKVAIVQSIESWTTEDITIKLIYEDKPSDYEIQYKIGDGEWVTGTEVTTTANNTTILARLFNSTTNDVIGQNSGKIGNIDKEKPTPPTKIEEVVIVENSDTKVPYMVRVQARGGTDSGSGVAGYKYSTDKTTWTDTISLNETYSINYSTISTETLPSAWESSKVATVVTEGTRKAPIPVGYSVSASSEEDNISEGLVIYQREDRVVPTIYAKTVDWVGNESEIYTLDYREKINQYVWIPVDDINDMVMCKKNGTTGTSGTTCALTYNESTEQITCSTHNYTTATALTDSTIDTTGLAGRAYGVTLTEPDANGIYATEMVFTETTKNAQRFTKDSGDREPDLVTYYDKDDETSGKTYMADAGITDKKAATLKAQLNSDFIAMAKSVAKYGGFYISRYEPGYINSKVISQKNKPVLTAAASNSTNYIAGKMWYVLYNRTLNSTEKEESVNSHMIWGCQYDQVINFLGKENAEIAHDYQTKRQQKTGFADDQDILNNIYDLEGNNFEWTAQAGNTNIRISRGGYYGAANTSNIYPASRRYDRSAPANIYENCTTRLMLYVK